MLRWSACIRSGKKTVLFLLTGPLNHKSKPGQAIPDFKSQHSKQPSVMKLQRVEETFHPDYTRKGIQKPNFNHYWFKTGS